MFDRLNAIISDPFTLRCLAFGTVVFVFVIVGIFAHYPYEE